MFWCHHSNEPKMGILTHPCQNQTSRRPTHLVWAPRINSFKTYSAKGGPFARPVPSDSRLKRLARQGAEAQAEAGDYRRGAAYEAQLVLLQASFATPIECLRWWASHVHVESASRQWPTVPCPKET